MNRTTLPIIVGVASGEDCTASVGFAVDEARRRRQPLVLVHVVRSMLEDPRGETDPALLDRGPMWRASKRQLDEAASYITHHLGSGVPVSTRVLTGSPEHALIEAGKGAEMVVLQPGGDPTHGLLIDHSVTTAVAARSTEPVVAVPQRWDPLVGTGTVTVALAAVAGSAHLVRTALEEARLRGATLRVLHLWYDKDAYDVFPSPQKEAYSAALAEGIRRDIEPACAAFDVPVEVVVRLGRPAEELVRASARTDLMVLARHYTGRRVSHHLGWKTRAVLHDARCPVMVVDPIDRLGLRIPA